MTINCVKCSYPKTVSCTPEQYQQWQAGELIQHAMPDVPKEERELLISGICGACWLKLFIKQEEETEEENL